MTALNLSLLMLRGNVYVAGELWTEINSKFYFYVAKWNKSSNSWSKPGITSISSFNIGISSPVTIDGSGNVYACGINQIPDYSATYQVVKLDGSNWIELGSPNQPDCYYLNSIITDSKGNVYTSEFDYDTGLPFVSKWNKSTNSWSKLIGTNQFDFGSEAKPITTDALDNVYTAESNTNPSHFVAKWDGSNWIEVGGTNSQSFGIDYYISSIATDAIGNVYAALSNNIDTKSVAKWNKSTNTWSFLNDIIPTASEQPIVNTIITDASCNIYAAGDICNSDYKKYVAKWDGTKWNDFGILWANNSINSICFDASGNMYAGGAFTNSDGNPYVAVYYK